MNKNIEKRVKEMVDYAYQNVPFYIKLKEKTKSENTIIDKNMITDIGDFVSVKYMFGKNKELIKTETSGSTGKCFEIIWNKKDYNKSMLSLWVYRYKYYGVKPNDRFCYFFSMENTITDNFYEYSENALGFSKCNLTEDRLLEICNMILEYNPVWLNLQPSIAILLAECFKKNKLKKIDGLKYIELTGEMLLDSTRKEIENIFDCAIANQYGCYEGNSIAYECPYGNMHCMEDNIYTEIVDEGGESVSGALEGNIIITTLHSHVMPFIRYKIGDLGIIDNTHKCKCGNCSPILKLTSGRISDYAIMKDGSKVSSYVFVRAVEIINRKYENVIRQFRVIQKEYDFFVVELVLDEDAVENLITEREVEDEFLYLLNDERLYDTEFEFKYYNEFKLKDNEKKLRYFIREIN